MNVVSVTSQQFREQQDAVAGTRGSAGVRVRPVRTRSLKVNAEPVSPYPRTCPTNGSGEQTADCAEYPGLPPAGCLCAGWRVLLRGTWPAASEREPCGLAVTIPARGERGAISFPLLKHRFLSRPFKSVHLGRDGGGKTLQDLTARAGRAVGGISTTTPPSAPLPSAAGVLIGLSFTLSLASFGGKYSVHKYENKPIIDP